jgi:hypothetical protein
MSVEPSSLRLHPLKALMDLYRDVVGEFSQIIGGLALKPYRLVCFPDAEDEDTRSIQAVVQHVVRSGNGYTNLIRRALDLPIHAPPQPSSWTPDQALLDLQAMIEATAQSFEGFWNMPDAMLEQTLIQSHWGPRFNLEQMFEHAIVHILRHHRQVQRYILAFDMHSLGNC